MELNQSNSPAIKAKELKRDLGDLEVLPDDIILGILNFVIDWNPKNEKEALHAIDNLCKTNKYLYSIVHEKLFKIKNVEEYRILIKKMRGYTLLKIKENNKKKNAGEKAASSISDKGYLTNIEQWSALHLASWDRDVKFVQGVLPELYKRKMLNIINEKIKSDDEFESGNTPLSCLMKKNMGDMSDEKCAKLIHFYIDNGAKEGTCGFRGLVCALNCRMWETAKAIMNGCDCETIMQAYSIFNDSMTGTKANFVQTNHACGNCKFK